MYIIKSSQWKSLMSFIKAPLNVKASEINACKQVNVHY